MTAADNNEIDKRGNFWLPALCVLLTAVIVLQIIILFRTNSIASRASTTSYGTQAQPHPPVVSASKTAADATAVLHPAFNMPHDEEIADLIRETHAMFEAMHSSFPDPFRHFRRIDPFERFDRGWESAVLVPTMDMRDTGDDYLIVMSVPSTNLTDITLTLDGRLLTVQSSETAGGGNDRSYSSFSTVVQVPGPVAAPELVKASFTNGLLRITIPKPAGQRLRERKSRIQ